MASYYDQHARQLKRDLAAEVPTEALRELHQKRPLLHAVVALANFAALGLAGSPSFVCSIGTFGCRVR